jgi:hypothetical protein
MAFAHSTCSPSNCWASCGHLLSFVCYSFKQTTLIHIYGHISTMFVKVLCNILQLWFSSVFLFSRYIHHLPFVPYHLNGSRILKLHHQSRVFQLDNVQFLCCHWAKFHQRLCFVPLTNNYPILFQPFNVEIFAATRVPIRLQHYKKCRGWLYI